MPSKNCKTGRGTLWSDSSLIIRAKPNVTEPSVHTLAAAGSYCPSRPGGWGCIELALALKVSMATNGAPCMIGAVKVVVAGRRSLAVESSRSLMVITSEERQSGSSRPWMSCGRGGGKRKSLHMQSRPL